MKIYSKKIPNTDISVFLREDSSDSDIYNILIENEEYGYFDLTYSPSVIIDAGANIGLASIYFMLKYPSAKILSIEPELENYNLLVKNTEKYQNILTFNVALSAFNGNGKIIDTGQGDLGYQVDMYNDFPQDKVLEEVKCLTFQSFFDNNRITTVDILKIDIEGMEKKIFESDCSWLANVNVLVIELHERLCEGCNKTVFSVVKNYFDSEWIGGENYIFSKKGYAIPTIPNCFKTASPQKLPVEQVWELQEKYAMNENNIYKILEPIYHRIDNLESLFETVQEIQSDLEKQRIENRNYMTFLQQAVEEIQVDREQKSKQQQTAFSQLQQDIDNIRIERDKQIIAYDKSLCELQKEVKLLHVETESKILYMENVLAELQEEMEQFKQTIWYRIYKKTRGGKS